MHKHTWNWCETPSTQVGCGDTGIHGVDGDPCSLKLTRQLVGEEQHSKFRLAIGTQKAVPMLELQIMHLKASTSFHARTHLNNPGKCAPLEHIEEQVRQQKGGEIVHGKGHLQPIDGFLPLTKGRSRIINEHMQLPVALLEGCCKLPDGLLRRQIREQEVYGIIAALSLDSELCLFASRAITTNHDHGCPHASQSEGRGLADP